MLSKKSAHNYQFITCFGLQKMIWTLNFIKKWFIAGGGKKLDFSGCRHRIDMICKMRILYVSNNTLQTFGQQVSVD